MRTARRTLYANNAMRVLYAFILRNRRQPTLLLALEGTTWRFDGDGKVDFSVPSFDDRRIGLSTPFVADVLPQDALQTGDRWQPGPAVHKAVEAKIWPSGRNTPLAPESGAPARPDSGKCLTHALAAVGNAGLARTMSRLVAELSLSQQTTQRLMASLAVNQQTLHDLIAAEAVGDEFLVH